MDLYPVSLVSSSFCFKNIEFDQHLIVWCIELQELIIDDHSYPAHSVSLDNAPRFIKLLNALLNGFLYPWESGRLLFY